MNFMEQRVMHNCGQNEEISAYIDGELVPAARRAFERHLEGCDVCRQGVARLQELQRQLRTLPPRTVGYDLAAQVHARSGQERTPMRPRLPWRLSVLVPLSSAMAATIALGVYLGFLINRPDESLLPIPELVLLDPVPPCSASISAMVLL